MFSEFIPVLVLIPKMEHDSMMNVLTESYSDDTVTKLINIFNFKSVDDLVRGHYQAYKLSDMYDTFLAMLRFKILHRGRCGMCPDTCNGGDVIDGPCRCVIFNRNKFALQQALKSFEDSSASEHFKKFYLDILQKT